MSYRIQDPNKMPGPGDPETWGPYTGHPLDPRAPDDSYPVEDCQWEIFKERMLDEGFSWLVESISEAPDLYLVSLAEAVVEYLDHGGDEAAAKIGRKVAVMCDRYAMPDEATAREELIARGADDGDRAYDEWRDRDVDDGL